MTKKIIIATTIILCTIFACTYSFAANEIKNAANDVRNGVGNVENGVENVAKDVTGAIRQGTNNVENAGGNMTNDMTRNNTTSTTTTNSGNTNRGYTAARTSTGIFGTSSTMWTWLILAIVAVVIIGLVWYYAMQKNNSHDNY